MHQVYMLFINPKSSFNVICCAKYVNLFHAEASKLIFKCDIVYSVATTATASHIVKCALLYLCCRNRAGLVSCIDPDGSPSQQVLLHRCVPVHLCLYSDCTPVGNMQPDSRKTSSGVDPPACLW